MKHTFKTTNLAILARKVDFAYRQILRIFIIFQLTRAGDGMTFSLFSAYR